MGKVEAESPFTTQILKHHFCYSLMVTSDCGACPDSRGKELTFCLGWEAASSRRAYGLRDIAATIFGKYSLSQMKVMSMQQEAGITNSFIVQDLALKH